MLARTTPALLALLSSISVACGSVIVEPSGAGGAGGAGGASTTTTSNSTTSSSTSQTTGTAGSGGTTSGCQSSAECPAGGVCSQATCDQGLCGLAPAPLGLACPEGVCDGMGLCVECVTTFDCPLGEQCVNETCQIGATCVDGMLDGDETDVDCGGSCPPCLPPPPCADDLECPSGYCQSGKCPEAVLINEVRTSGPMGGVFDDEIVELRNPGTVPVVFDSGWVLWHRSAQNACQSQVKRYQGKGQVIPPYGRLLLVGPDYAQAVAPDDVLQSTPGNSIADSGSLWIEHNGSVIDALCYFADASSLARLQGGCAQAYQCLGAPVSNLPHDGSPLGGVDASLTRKEDALGLPVNARNNAVDFAMVSPATPQGLSGP